MPPALPVAMDVRHPFLNWRANPAASRGECARPACSMKCAGVTLGRDLPEHLEQRPGTDARAQVHVQEVVSVVPGDAFGHLLQVGLEVRMKAGLGFEVLDQAGGVLYAPDRPAQAFFVLVDKGQVIDQLAFDGVDSFDEMTFRAHASPPGSGAPGGG